MGGILIAGTGSGCGKTTVSIAVMAALKEKGIDIAPFKVGPDYIDPGFHKHVTKNFSHNLDLFMNSEESVKYLYNHYSADKFSVVEGVMGMYDGHIMTGNASSAHTAKVLGIPVVLVVDGRGVSTTIAAIVKGLCDFDKDVPLKYVIINKVSSEVHYNILKYQIEKYTDVKCVGYLKKQDDVALDSRHLGLIPHDEVLGLNERIEKLSGMAKEGIDLNFLIDVCKRQEIRKVQRPKKLDEFIYKHKDEFVGKRIGVAMDIAFTFYYQANIDLLKMLGAEIVPFSPMKDEKLPHDLDSVYFGGGFPEIFAKELYENKSFMIDVKEKLDNGLKCYAECGGYMYLSKSIVGLDNKKHDMVGFFDVACEMTKRLQRFGYIEMEALGEKVFAHEFHRSKMIGEKNDIMEIRKKRPFEEDYRTWTCGNKKKNVIGGYPHIHFYSNFEFLRKVLIND